MDGHFQRITAANGVVYYTCDALQAPHGFSTRLGGVSGGGFGTLNLGLSGGDQPAAVRTNRSLWREAVGFPTEPHCLHQVHGAVVHLLEAANDEPSSSRQGDALVTAVPARAIGVYTADCGPVLLAAPGGAVVAAAHAGWRGAAAGVAANAAGALARRAGCGPGALVVALGPMIRACCFEVGDEVVEAFSTQPWFQASCVARGPSARPRLDLPALIRLQLMHAGVPGTHIHDLGLCTMCLASEFHSWRRDGSASGRMQAAIAPRGLYA
ncbi:MAG: peptidoglycan editing factor PgeF [Candidatus Sericytochromatia bacterium]|nr:peptidoglycan editing factor PgeF [Candidatus Sericytochromatia bacterium]